MAVIKATQTSQPNKIVAGYTPAKRNYVSTTKRRAYVAIIKRSNPINTNTKVNSTPVVTPEAKLATATTAFKSALEAFDSSLSSISGSFPSDYKKTIQDALNTISAATKTINATVDIAKLPPPLNGNLSSVTQPLPPPVNDIGSSPPIETVAPVSPETSQESQSGATLNVGAELNAIPEISNTPIDDTPEENIQEFNWPFSNKLTHYPNAQSVSPAESALDDAEPQLSVIA